MFFLQILPIWKEFALSPDQSITVQKAGFFHVLLKDPRETPLRIARISGDPAFLPLRKAHRDWVTLQDHAVLEESIKTRVKSHALCSIPATPLEKPKVQQPRFTTTIISNSLILINTIFLRWISPRWGGAVLNRWSSPGVVEPQPASQGRPAEMLAGMKLVSKSQLETSSMKRSSLKFSCIQYSYCFLHRMLGSPTNSPSTYRKDSLRQHTPINAHTTEMDRGVSLWNHHRWTHLRVCTLAGRIKVLPHCSAGIQPELTLSKCIQVLMRQPGVSTNTAELFSNPP